MNNPLNNPRIHRLHKSAPLFLLLFALSACGPEGPTPALERPSVASVQPASGAANVPLETDVVATLTLPEEAAVDKTTLASGVQLVSGAGVSIPGTATAEGDRLTFAPTSDLAAGTQYTFMVTSALEDDRGAAFEPFSTSFTTVQDTPGNVPAGEVGLEPASQELIFSTVQGGTSGDQTVTVTNTGDASLTLTEAQLTGTNEQDFTLTPSPVPVTLMPGQQAQFKLAFTPRMGVTGSLGATLTLTLEDAKTVQVRLFGLSSQGTGGDKEPPLQAVVDTLGYAVNVGGSKLELGTNPQPIGDEVAASLFQKVGPGPVILTPVARYSPAETLPFGYYTLQNSAPVLHQVGALSSATSESQTLNPALEGGGETFEPEAEPFGFYVNSQVFKRASYTQDQYNTAPQQTAHAARVYPLKNRAGQALANTYLVAFEDANNGDYQDYVFVVKNVQPAQ